MSLVSKAIVSLTVIASISAIVMAQPPGPQGGSEGPGGFGGRGPGGPGGPPPSPVVEVMDTNHDHALSAQEIKNAFRALKVLDRDGDGNLSQEEMRPEGGPERGRPGGFGGPEGRGRDGRGRDGRPGGRGLQTGRGGSQFPGEPGSADRASQMLSRMMTFDENGDGQLSMEEVPERMQAILKRYDSDKNELLDHSELQQMAIQPGGQRGGSAERGQDGPGAERGRGVPGGDRPGGDRPGGPGFDRPGFRGPSGPGEAGGRGRPPGPEEFIQRAMRHDRDNDGKLDRAELLAALEEMERARRGGGPDNVGGNAGRPGRPANASDRPQRPTRPATDN